LLVPALIGTIKLALQPRGYLVSDSPKLALMALTMRKEETMAKFLDHAQSKFPHSFLNWLSDTSEQVQGC
jgi:hypothetical protein